MRSSDKATCMASDERDDARLASGKSAARNRVVQQRYRERQKDKLKQYEQQVEILGRRVRSLEVENRSLGDRNRLLERLAQLAEQSSDNPDATSVETEQLSVWQKREIAAAVASVMNAVSRNKQPLMTAEQAASVTYKELNDVDVTFARTIAQMMLGGVQPGTPACSELEDYVLQYRHAWIQLANTYSLQVAAKLMAADKGRPPPVFKPSLVAALGLSPDQRRDFLQARRQVLQGFEDIRSSRRRITQEFAKSLEVGEPEPSGTPEVDHMVLKMKASDNFRDSLTAELRLLVRFWQTCTQILTPLQEARGLMDIFPDVWLDVWMLASYLEAEEQGSLAPWLATFATPEGVARYLREHEGGARGGPAAAGGGRGDAAGTSGGAAVGGGSGTAGQQFDASMLGPPPMHLHDLHMGFEDDEMDEFLAMLADSRGLR